MKKVMKDLSCNIALMLSMVIFGYECFCFINSRSSHVPLIRFSGTSCSSIRDGITNIERDTYTIIECEQSVPYDSSLIYPILDDQNRIKHKPEPSVHFPHNFLDSYHPIDILIQEFCIYESSNIRIIDNATTSKVDLTTTELFLDVGFVGKHVLFLTWLYTFIGFMGRELPWIYGNNLNDLDRFNNKH
ncbi:hypothetical protein BDA99DRAFT_532954 [Phascolomyces articulosus]|uniref:Uncharacterized protein n=1 Tax=Phascolomyces articulosus TaxID=60185 RepID=A0AAD5K822_9FUNG|nr:hypothetical protein BDA99DRAFT_532954 [Phascolomyces articulosus]